MHIVCLDCSFIRCLNKLCGRTAKNHKRSNRLIKRVKKPTLLASICLATDLSILAAQFLLIKNTNAMTFSFSLNLEINLFVRIACFDHWKKMLWPWNFKYCKNSGLGWRKSDAITSMSTMSTRDHGNCATVVSVAKKKLAEIFFDKRGQHRWKDCCNIDG